MTEAGNLILAWLNDEFSKYKWERYSSNYYVDSKNKELDTIQGVIGGVTLELRIVDLEVSIYVKTPYKMSNKVRSVQLTNPTSIDNLKEVMTHTIKFTTNPYWTPG